jgi:hypothetical protein
MFVIQELKIYSTFIIPSLPHVVSPDKTAYYHTLGSKLGASSVTKDLTNLGVKAV